MDLKNRHLSLSRRLFLVGIVPILISFIFLSTSSYWIISDISSDNVKSRMERSLTDVENRVEGIFAPFAYELESFALVAETGADKDSLDVTIHAYSNVLGASCSMYYATAISRYEPDGYYLDNTDWVPEPDWIPTQRDWYKAAVSAGGKLAFSDPYVDAMTKSLCITISRLVKVDGKTKGVAAIDIYLTNLSETMEEVGISQNGKLFLVNESGIYLTNSNADKILSSTFFDDNPEFEKTESRNFFLDGGEHIFVHDDFYCGIKKLSILPWYAVAVGPMSDFTENLKNSIMHMIVVFVVILALTVLLSFFTSRRISVTFKNMAAQCRNIATGDFSAEYADSSISEASELVRGFDAFSESVSNLVKEIHKSTDYVQDVSDGLARTADEIKNSVSQTDESISGMDDDISKQNGAVESVGKAVDCVADEMRNLTEKICRQDSLVESSSSKIYWMVESLNEISGEINNLSQSFEQLVSDVNKNSSALESAVDQILAAAGGSASDLLENIPSVEVTTDGEISLRGNSSVEVWINGKASGLTTDNRAEILQQIPAESIERIEVIDNPSAKYSPEGSAGIINIVLKRDRKAGYYGSLRVGANIYGGWNTGANINYSSGVLDAYANLGYRRRKNQGGSESQQNYKQTNEYQNYESEEKRRGGGLFARMGLTWHFTKNDDLSLGGMTLQGNHKSTT
ncbi:MAG: TonB-dependent receptor plug domain-containing protein, partial [Treponema sp.]|nr:TonB-dependent receptor plug domain-containing protein [Treponema sp.]